MTLHLLGLPWTETTKRWEAEAFTARTRVLGTMLSKFGRVVLYAGEENESHVTEHVCVATRAWQALRFPGFKTSDVFDDYDPGRAHWIEFNVRAADEIRKRAHPGDLLGISMGTSQQLVALLLDDLGLIPVEVGVGYKGVWASYRVYESWAWRQFHAGLAVGMSGQDTAGDVRNFDEVIPRPYEVEDFPAGDGRGGYFVFMGRVVNRKGPHIAAEVCRRMGAKLVVVGQNVASVEPGKIVSSDGTVMVGDVEYAGVIGPADRARVLGGATAVFCPTLYDEPFGGVHAEAMLTGTPVLSADWGVFHENIDNGVNGWRCRDLDEFVRAAERAGSLDRDAIRNRALMKFTTDAVGPQYDEYFQRLVTLRREGWYEMPMRSVSAK